MKIFNRPPIVSTGEREFQKCLEFLRAPFYYFAPGRERETERERRRKYLAKRQRQEKERRRWCNEAKKRVRWRSNTNRREWWQAARRRCPNTPATLSECEAAAGTGPAFCRSVGHRFLAPSSSSCLVPHSFRLGHVNASNTAAGLRAGRFNNASSANLHFLPSFLLPSRPLPCRLSRDHGFRKQLETNRPTDTNIPPFTFVQQHTRALATREFCFGQTPRARTTLYYCSSRPRLVSPLI